MTKKSFQMATMRDNKLGRPPGGIGWIVNKNFPFEIDCSFINDKISLISYGSQSIIGVYLLNGSQSTKRDQHEEMLHKTIALANEQKINGRETIIIGDLNTDPTRNKINDAIDTKIINESGLVFLEAMLLQKTTYSYKSPIGQSWIDHVLVDDSSRENIQVNIISSVHNMSDHNALSLDREHFIMENKDTEELSSCNSSNNINQTKHIKQKWTNKNYKVRNRIN
ncbi:hypothetical protein BpHYR1_013121 [Brachionus plicatilis]|uniref:Endonuclease/exonuclease/phosphatase domain-containing protein n=1 Tax=Brachionus plicatilis TaxID=10195 RepID=A0A3M7Q9I1_BRAPC|nr:hypothetical protein BpHYR1_013121 [Brachionus plicatilis]